MEIEIKLNRRFRVAVQSRIIIKSLKFDLLTLEVWFVHNVAEEQKWYFGPEYCWRLQCMSECSWNLFMSHLIVERRQLLCGWSS